MMSRLPASLAAMHLERAPSRREPVWIDDGQQQERIQAVNSKRRHAQVDSRIQAATVNYSTVPRYTSSHQHFI